MPRLLTQRPLFDDFCSDAIRSNRQSTQSRHNANPRWDSRFHERERMPHTPVDRRRWWRWWWSPNRPTNNDRKNSYNKYYCKYIEVYEILFFWSILHFYPIRPHYCFLMVWNLLPFRFAAAFSPLTSGEQRGQRRRTRRRCYNWGSSIVIAGHSFLQCNEGTGFRFLW